MVCLFDRTGSTMLEDRASFCAAHDHGLRYRIALWTQRGRVRLLGGNDVVGYSTYFVVRTRYTDFAPGYSVNSKPATGLRPPGRRARLWSAADMRPIRFSFATPCAGKWRAFHCILRGAFVCYGAEVTVPGSPEGIARAFISCGERILISCREGLRLGLIPLPYQVDLAM